MAITIKESDFPAGTPNHLGMRVGCYILFGACTAVVLARIYVRTIMAHKLGLDDILIFTAWAAEVVVIVCVKLMFESGIGWHTADIMTLPNGMDVLTRMVLWPWVTQILYFFGLGCIKASIVALYLRLAVTDMQKRILWGALIFVMLQGLASAITVAGFLCSPISIVWTGKHGGFGGPNCVNILAFNYYNAAVFIATDIALAIGPVFIIRKLQMDRRKQIGLSIMFALGMLAIGGTISRQVTNAIAIISTSDFTWYWAAAELCSVLESSLGIVFVSMPALAPLFQSLISGTSAMNSTSKNGAYKLSDRPGTFGKIGVRPKLRPDDESFLYATQVTAVDPKDQDGVVESYEADRTTTHSHGDSGSERAIIPRNENLAADNSRREERLSQNKGKVHMNVEYSVERSERQSTDI